MTIFSHGIHALTCAYSDPNRSLIPGKFKDFFRIFYAVRCSFSGFYVNAQIVGRFERADNPGYQHYLKFAQLFGL